MLRKISVTVSIAVLCLFTASAAQASSIAIINSNSGWYNDNGEGQGLNPGLNGQNYFSGDFDGDHYHNFFIFNLGSLAGATITGATLQLYTGDVTDDGTYSTYDVSTAPATLNDGTGGIPAYNDLGGGVFFGSTALTIGQADSVVAFGLNAGAIAAIQAGVGGMFSIGGDFVGAAGGWAFGFTDFDQRNQLIIEYEGGNNVPDGGLTLGLLGGAMMALGALRRRFM